jgi:hypothetical protein
MTNPYCRRRKAGILTGSLAIAIAVVGCGAPVPTTPAGQSQTAGQQCTVCRLENPGDVSACAAVCMQRIEDLSASKGFSHP